jgi:hypothetical protein
MPDPSAWAVLPGAKPDPPDDVTVMSTTPGATFLYSWVSVVVVDRAAADWAGTEATTVFCAPLDPDEAA